MVIEAMVRWTEMRAKDTDTNDDIKDLQDLLNSDADENERPQIEIKYDYSPMCFNLEDVRRFNKGHDADLTTIRFGDGDSFVVQIPYDKFRDIYSEYTGSTVLSVITVPKNSKKPKPKKGDDPIPPSDLNLDF